MLFSVIIPVYNSEAYLHKCIGSILQQNYRDYEYIFVDGKSKDNSLAVIERYLGVGK